MKKLVSLILALVLCFSLSATALALTVDVPEDEFVEAAAIKPGDSPQYEETKWYYRITDTGLFQQRLWSITYGKWLTEWITIGYV